MNRFWAPSSVFVLALLTLSCGSSGRQLQSISIDKTVNGETVQFTATGTFSAAPTTVTPLPVFWAGAPPGPRYSLSADPLLINCTSAGPYPGPIVAMAPADPNAPSTGSTSAKMISTSMGVNCP